MSSVDNLISSILLSLSQAVAVGVYQCSPWTTTLQVQILLKSVFFEKMGQTRPLFLFLFVLFSLEFQEYKLMVGSEFEPTAAGY